MNKGFVFGESYFLSAVFEQDKDALWWHMKQMPNIMMCLLCLYIISIMFDVLADHRKNLLIQMCRVELQVGLSIS